jgi:hypothetical protein
MDAPSAGARPHSAASAFRSIREGSLGRCAVQAEISGKNGPRPISRVLFFKRLRSLSPSRSDRPAHRSGSLGAVATSPVFLPPMRIQSFRSLPSRRGASPAIPRPSWCSIASRGDAPYDITSRSFAPDQGLAEDPSAGGTHCRLAPFRARRLGKPELRGGEILSRAGDGVELEGACVSCMEGAVTP